MNTEEIDAGIYSSPRVVGELLEETVTFYRRFVVVGGMELDVAAVWNAGT